MSLVSPIIHFITYFFCFQVQLNSQKMCLVNCCIEGTYRLCVTIFLMLDNIIRMFLFNTYDILTVCCQICSVIPILMVFILTTKLKCVICNRSNICAAGYGQCPMIATLCFLVFLYYVFNAFNAVDPFFKMLGYVKEIEKDGRAEQSTTNTSTSQNTTQYTTFQNYTTQRVASSNGDNTT